MEKLITMKAKKERNSKPKYNLWQNSAYMISAAWADNKSVLWLCLVSAALTVTANVLNLLVTPTILGAVENAVPLDKLVTTILFFAGAMMLTSAASSYCSHNTLFGRIAVRVVILSRIQKKLSKASYPNTEDQEFRKKQDKANMTTNANSSAAEAIWNTLTDILVNIAGFIIYLILLSSLEPWILAVVLVTTVTGFFTGKYINGWGYRHRDEEEEYSRRMNYISGKAADYTLAKDIRIFGMRGWLNDMYDSTFGLYQAFIARGEKVYIWGNIIDIVLSFARNGIAYIYLIGLVLTNGLSAAQFLLYFTAVGGFTTWVSGILSGFAILHKQSLELNTVREFLEYPELFTFEAGRMIEPDNKKTYQIELRNVTFRYPGADKDTLTNVNLTIKAGEKLAVVGLNGAGKTTLVKLACGFYDPTEGEVLLNGEDIRQFNRRDYYRHFSAVFQDFSVLAVPIAENVAQTDTDIDMAKVIACVEKAGLTAKIEGLPKKYGTPVGKEVYEDGVELSGGEMQRLMLARALYKDAPIILLDEPTAALDPIAECDVYKKYNDLIGGRTAVYISHRLASTHFCDRVIYIDGGGIAEDGTHDSLIKKGGKYAELFEIQSHYYREGVVENEAK